MPVAIIKNKGDFNKSFKLAAKTAKKVKKKTAQGDR